MDAPLRPPSDDLARPRWRAQRFRSGWRAALADGLLLALVPLALVISASLGLRQGASLRHRTVNDPHSISMIAATPTPTLTSTSTPTPTPTPTQAPTPTPTPTVAPTHAPTSAPTPVPTTAPTTVPGVTPTTNSEPNWLVVGLAIFAGLLLMTLVALIFFLIGRHNRPPQQPGQPPTGMPGAPYGEPPSPGAMPHGQLGYGQDVYPPGPPSAPAGHPTEPQSPAAPARSPEEHGPAAYPRSEPGGYPLPGTRPPAGPPYEYPPAAAPRPGQAPYPEEPPQGPWPMPSAPSDPAGER